MTEFDKEVGRRIRMFRLQVDMTQRVLANTAGISRSFMCEVEKGKRGLGFENALRIARALMVPAESLAGDKR